MDNVIKVLVSVIALISGLLAVVKAALDILKEYQANKETVSSLLARRRFWIAVSLAFIGFIVLSAAVWWSTSRGQFVLTVQVWDVEQDQKHTMITSKQFSGSSASDLPEQTLQEVGRWVVEQVGQKYNLNAGDVQVHVHIPADLTKENLNVQIMPPGPFQAYVYIVEQGNKSRIPLDQQALLQYGKDFTLEIRRPGYEAKTIFVKWQHALDEDLSLQPQPVGIGIEEFRGEKNSVAAWLMDYLTANPRFSVKDPSTLKALQDRIAQEKEAIAKNPFIQSGLRTSLGADLIITGSLDWR